jgi:enoyl-CoA hydratase/carnithine racemase
MPEGAAAPVLFEMHGAIAVATLNRPAALNALTFEMIGQLRAWLKRSACDPKVRAIVLRGAGGKAFCAGGDIRALYQSFRESGTLHRDFFVAEYRLDYLLHRYPKPYVVLMDGITMGGGMGLAQASRCRVAGELSRIAMPEVGIGLFPDVGASYFLSRLPGALGAYLALTGVTLGGSDAVYAGLADVCLPPTAAAKLIDTLVRIAWSEDAEADVRRTLYTLAVTSTAVAAPVGAANAPAPLEALRPAIDRHFSQPSVTGILASLDAETAPEFDDWARKTAALMRTRSPTMLCVALRQWQTGSTRSLADCFRLELGMVEQSFDQGDFAEGIRALIIDKDNQPRWRPTRLKDVGAASVDLFFEPRWRAGDHPLEDLEETIRELQ